MYTNNTKSYLLMRISIRIIIPIIMDMQQKEVLFAMRLFIVFYPS